MAFASSTRRWCRRRRTSSRHVTGIVYCGTIAGCRDAFELASSPGVDDGAERLVRAQPEMVSFSGQCLVHRAEILQLRGDWPEAVAEAQRAHERCLAAAQPAGGGDGRSTFSGEVHRLRGELGEGRERRTRGRPRRLRAAAGAGAAAPRAGRRRRGGSGDQTGAGRDRRAPAGAPRCSGLRRDHARRRRRSTRRAYGGRRARRDRRGRGRAGARRDGGAGARGAVEPRAGRPAARRSPRCAGPRGYGGTSGRRTRLPACACWSGQACRALGDEDAAAIELEAARAAFASWERRPTWPGSKR